MNDRPDTGARAGLASGARTALRARLALALALIALIAALGVVTRTVERAASRASFAAAVERETGVKLAATQSISLVLWPSPGVVARRVVLAPDGPLKAGRIDSLSIQFDWAALIQGRLRASGLIVDGADLSVDAAERAPSAWRAAISRDGRRLGRLRVSALSLSLAGLPDGPRSVRVLSADVNWSDAARPLSGQARALLSEDATPFETSFYVHRPVDLWNGRAGVVMARVSHPILSFSAQGEYAEGVGFRGKITARSDDVGALDRRGWIDAPGAAGVARASLRADAAWTHRGLALTDAALMLDANRLDGSLNLRHEDGRPVLAGNLAADVLDATPWLTGAPSLLTQSADGSQRWRDAAIEWEAETRGDADLRVSAQTLTAGSLKARNVAFALLMKKGRLDVALSDATIFKGVVRGRLAVQPTLDGLNVKAAARWTGIELGALPRRVDRPRWTGLADGQVEFDALGRSPAELAAALDGKAQIVVAAGDVRGFDVEAAARRSQRKPAPIVRADAVRTSFNELKASLRVLRGSGDIEQLSLSGPGVTAVGRGVFDLGRLTISARVEATPTRAASPIVPPPFVFHLRGPLLSPRLVADAAPPTPLESSTEGPNSP